MNKNKKKRRKRNDNSLKKHWKLLSLIAFVCIVVIPFLIHCAFKMYFGIDFFVADWSAGDILTFYGGILAAVLAVFGVYWTIQDSHNQYHEEQKNNVKPYFAVTIRKQEFHRDLLPDENTNDEAEFEDEEINGYSEYRREKVFIVIQKNQIEFPLHFTKKQKETISKMGSYWQHKESSYILCQKNYISLPLDIDNVGIKAAINVQVVFFKTDAEQRDRVYVYTMKPADRIYVHIYSGVEDDSICGDYLLDLKYWDILGTAYSQKYPIRINLDEDDRFICYTDLRGTQVEVEDAENG